MAEHESSREGKTDLAILDEEIDTARWAVDRAAAKLDASSNDRPDWSGLCEWYRTVHAQHAALVAQRDQLLKLKRARGER